MRSLLATFCIGLASLMGFAINVACAQPAASFKSRYRLPSGAELRYHLKIYRSPSVMKPRGLIEGEDSVEADILIDVVANGPNGTMVLNTTVEALREGSRGADWNYSVIPLPPRAYIELDSRGRGKFAAVIKEDSGRHVTKVLSRTPAGTHMPLMRDDDYVRKFIRMFFPMYGNAALVYDGEVVTDSLHGKDSYRFEEYRDVEGQQDPKLVAPLKKEHAAWIDTARVIGPGSFNGIPVFKIEHRNVGEGARFEKFSAGRTGRREVGDFRNATDAYFAIDNGRLVALDFSERVRLGEVVWNNRTTVRLISVHQLP